RSRRLASTQLRLRSVRSRRRSIQPVRPLGRSGSTALPHCPFLAVATIHSHVGVPSGVRPGTYAVTGPPGDACTAAPAGVDASRNRGPGALASAGLADAGASATAVAAMPIARTTRRFLTPTVPPDHRRIATPGADRTACQILCPEGTLR